MIRMEQKQLFTNERNKKLKGVFIDTQNGTQCQQAIKLIFFCFCIYLWKEHDL